MAIGTIPVPSPHIDDEPSVSVCINREWAGVLIGQIWDLRYPEAWGGTLDENRRARGEIKNLINMLMGEEGCGDMAICCEPAVYIFRINVTTGRLERSSDGGTVWTPDPNDPMFSTIQLPPVVGDTLDDTKCQAASNFSEHFDEIVSESSNQLGTAVTIFELVAGIAAFIIDVVIIVATGGAGIPLITTVTAAIFAAGAGAFAAGKAAFDSYWTADNKDKAFCAAYATIGDDGAFTEAQWNAFRNKVKVDLPPGAARDFVLSSVNAAGAAGGSNMAAYGAGSLKDCEGCDSTCNADLWSIVTYSGQPVGSIISRTAHSITVQGSGHPDFGTPYNAMIKTGADNTCCRVKSIEMLTGDMTAFGYYHVSCGVARWPDSTNNPFDPAITFTESNTVYVRKDSGSNFTAKITFD